MKEYVVEDGVIKIKFNTQQKGYVTVLFDIKDEEFVSNNKIRLKYDKTIDWFYVYSGLEAVHRILTCCPKGLVVDHVNRNPLDNRRENLRVCTTKENNNNRKVRCTNKTGISGIHIEGRTGKYITRLYIDNKRIYVGKFNTLDEAKEALERRRKLAL